MRRVLMEAAAKGGQGGLENAEWFMCEGAPVGAVKKRYVGERAEAYNKLCDAGTAEEIVK